jgi:hypothetical protein
VDVRVDTTADDFWPRDYDRNRGHRFSNVQQWRKEKIEERRIEIAIEALSIAYETKYVFENIRNPISFGQEWQDLPRAPNDTDATWAARGPSTRS